MSFDYKLLGKKLREARESLLIQPVEAAEQLQIGVDEYLQLESGEQLASGDQVVLLAALFRRDFRYFVTGDYPSAESQIQEMFRQNAALSKHDRIAIQEFARLCEYQAFLEEILGIQPKSLPDYSQHPFGHKNFKRQGAETATMERNRLTLGRRPIVDIFKMIRDQGLRVFKRELDDRNISGVYLRHPAAGHCILVNYLDDLYRQNFSAAHEYGHALFDSTKGQQVSYLSQLGEQGLEWRANSFAGNFLVPEERLKKDYSHPATYEELQKLVPQIAKRFDVNSQVIIYRFDDIGWIDNRTKGRLLRDRSIVIKAVEKFDPEIPFELSVGAKERLTQAIRNGLSWYFLQLCAEAYRRGEITYHKALEMLFLPMHEGMNLLNQISLFMEVSEP